MAKTASKISPKQKSIDKAWKLYHAAMEACEELGDHLQEMEDEFDIEETKAHRLAYRAHSTLEEGFSTGSPILPRASTDGGKA